MIMSFFSSRHTHENKGETKSASITLSAKAEAQRALQMSEEMGYHWGKVDAEEVLKNV
jgi:hypothetical protein